MDAGFAGTRFKVTVQMSAQSAKADLIVGGLSVASGIAIMLASRDYSQPARQFPMWLGATIVLCGAIIALSAWLRSRQAENPGGAPRPASSLWSGLRENGRLAVVLYALVMLGWSLVLSFGGGYLLPSIAAVVLLLIVAGERRPGRVILGAIGIAVFVFTMFYILFNARLPEADYIRELAASSRRLF